MSHRTLWLGAALMMLVGLLANEKSYMAGGAVLLWIGAACKDKQE